MTSNHCVLEEFNYTQTLDPRLISAIAPAVAKAAIESGVAREPITDWKAYEQTF